MATSANWRIYGGVRTVAALLLLALTGCTTSIAGIREKPAVETVVSPKSIDEIERCIVLSQPGGRTPYAVTTDGVRELTINQESAGAVMLFQMRPVGGGTEVTFRRKGGMVNFDDNARRCYAP